jgi:hypothetical protein
MIMYCGSIRSEAYATWDADAETGTSRFVASVRRGVMLRYGID